MSFLLSQKWSIVQVGFQGSNVIYVKPQKLSKTEKEKYITIENTIPEEVKLLAK